VTAASAEHWGREQCLVTPHTVRQIMQALADRRSMDPCHRSPRPLPRPRRAQDGPRDGQIAPPANVRPAVIVSLVKPANRPLPTRSGAVGCPG